MIERVVLRDRSANEAAGEDVGAADRGAVPLRCRIRLMAADRPCGVVQIRIARNVIVRGLAAVDVGVEGKIAAAGVEQNAAFDAAIDRAERAARLRGDARRGLCGGKRRLGRHAVALERRRARGQRVGNAIVGRAHHAADRGRAVAQRGGPAHHLNLVGRERIDRHEVILAEIGSAAGIGAVLDDADAIDVEPPDDRPAGSAGREARAGDAGFGEQEIAELAAARAPDLVVRHHGDGRELVGHDRQHALLGRGWRGSWRLLRPLAIAPGDAACGSHRRARGHRDPAYDGAGGGDGDCGQFGGDRLVLRQRRCRGHAEHEPARSAEALRAPQSECHCPDSSQAPFPQEGDDDLPS